MDLTKRPDNVWKKGP